MKVVPVMSVSSQWLFCEASKDANDENGEA